MKSILKMFGISVAGRDHPDRIGIWAAGGVLVRTGVGLTQVMVQNSRVNEAAVTRFPSDPVPTFGSRSSRVGSSAHKNQRARIELNRDTMKMNPINDGQAADEDRSELEFARAMCFWANLRFSLSQSKAREVTFNAAKRLLAARKAANDSAGTSTSVRGGGPEAYAKGLAAWSPSLAARRDHRATVPAAA